MLKQVDILKAVIVLLKTKFGYRIYSAEIQDSFKTPAFFVRLIKRTDAETLVFNSNQLSIIITYFPEKASNKEIEILNMKDDLNQLFALGFKAADRYLTTESFSTEEIGEKLDILQATITITYIDDTGRTDPNKGYDIAQELYTNMKG